MEAAAPLNNQQCLFCKKQVRGRSDKKFCDDNCRNNYNNALKSNTTNLVRNINNALGKNRRILEALLPAGEDTLRCNKDKLLEKGFLFKYSTHNYTTRNEQVYIFCYDMGYLPLENDWFLIVRRKEA